MCDPPPAPLTRPDEWVLLLALEPGHEDRATAAAAAAQLGAVADAAVATGPERDAYTEADRRHNDGLAELARAEGDLEVAEEELRRAVREARELAGPRQAVADAEQSVAAARVRVGRLCELECETAMAVVQKREAVWRELVAARLGELDSRRRELRAAAEAAIRDLGTELLAVDALERVLRT